jgi:hypothetical protein
VVGHPDHGVDGYLAPDAGGEVVEVEGEGGVVCDGAEERRVARRVVRPVEVRQGDEGGVRARRGRRLDSVQRPRDAGRRRPREDRRAVGVFDGRLDDGAVLRGREAGELARRPARHHPVDAAGEHVFDQRPERLVVHRAVGVEGRDERTVDSSKPSCDVRDHGSYSRTVQL